jgi:hypothetical protein
MPSQDYELRSTDKDGNSANYDRILRDYRQALTKMEEDIDREIDKARAQTVGRLLWTGTKRRIARKIDAGFETCRDCDRRNKIR